MKTYKKMLLVCTLVVGFLAFFNSVNADSLSLSQTSVNTSVGQYTTVTAYNSYTSLYISSNSNPSVASVSTTGNNSISIYGMANGSTTLNVCQYGTALCGYVYVTVGGSSSYNSLSLSQTSLYLTVGQTSTVTAYNNYNYGTLYVSSNLNPNVATAYASGNSVSVYGSTNGNTTIMICQSGSVNSCGTVYVTVSGYNNGYNNNYGYNYGTNNLGFNISSLSLSVGSSITISAANSNGLYVSQNSNPSIVSTSYGSASLVPGCTATSSYSVTTGQPCLNGLNIGGYSSIPGCTANTNYSPLTGQPCYSSTSYYTNNNYNNANNSAINILALKAGTDTITLCQNSGGNACSIISINSYALY